MNRRVTARRVTRNNGGTSNYALDILSLNPSEITAGSGDTVVQVNGGDFTGSTIIKVDGVTVTTTPFSINRVDATIPSAVIAVPGYKTLQAFDGLLFSNPRQ